MPDSTPVKSRVATTTAGSLGYHGTALAGAGLGEVVRRGGGGGASCGGTAGRRRRGRRDPRRDPVRAAPAEAVAQQDGDQQRAQGGAQAEAGVHPVDVAGAEVARGMHVQGGRRRRGGTTRTSLASLDGDVRPGKPRGEFAVPHVGAARDDRSVTLMRQRVLDFPGTPAPRGPLLPGHQSSCPAIWGRDDFRVHSAGSRQKPALAQARSRSASPKASAGPSAPAGRTPSAAARAAAQASIGAVNE